jgi:UDP-N-acetyl-D-glucosamine dehydrogenase
VYRLQQALNARSKSVKGSKLLIIGLSYKKDIGDIRESPAYQIIPMLIKLGAVIAYHDPFVPQILPTRNWPSPVALNSQPLTIETISSHDAVVIITDHTSIDYELIAKHAKMIIDSRGVYRKPLANVVKA